CSSGVAVALAVAAALGCGADKAAPPAEGTSLSPAGGSVTLRLGVVSDPALQRAIDRLRGEWAERGAGAFETIAIDGATPEALAGAKVDACVFPSLDLAVLCEGGALRPVRPGVLDDEELNWDDVAPLVREREAVYGGVVMALPLGSATPLLLGVPDAPGVSVPSGDVELALTLLAWAAPHAVHPSTVATLFDDVSMSPRLASPPFERALDELASAVDAANGATRGVCWPSRDQMLVGRERYAIEVASLPNAVEAYNPIAAAWEPTEVPATLVGSRGTLLGVTSRSRNAAATFRLAAWVAGVENSATLSIASSNVAVCRASLAGQPDRWVALSDRDDLSRGFANRNLAALRAERWLPVPRLPGGREYLAALGAAVRERLDGDATSAEVLAAATRDWEAITDELGRERQRLAYLRSVGLQPYDPPVR
ncbi:MAG: hypothetical protein ACRCT8_07735, partial [Lacipirellulaceae bacterium]